MTGKLTLSVNEQVIRQAKRYAKAKGTSVSTLVEGFLGSLGDRAESDQATPPVLRRLRGALRASSDEYSKYLQNKYR